MTSVQARAERFRSRISRCDEISRRDINRASVGRRAAPLERAPRVQPAGRRGVKMRRVVGTKREDRSARTRSVFKRVIIYPPGKMVIAGTEARNSVGLLARASEQRGLEESPLTILFNGPSCVTYDGGPVFLFSLPAETRATGIQREFSIIK